MSTSSWLALMLVATAVFLQLAHPTLGQDEEDDSSSPAPPTTTEEPDDDESSSQPSSVSPPPSCATGEQYVECSSACQPTCEDPNPICILPCYPPSCQCLPGYVRYQNDSEGCIPVDQCPTNSSVSPPPHNQTCPPGEQYRQCTTLCEPTCERPRPGPCPLICLPPGCQCKPNYYRNNCGRCVTLRQCPPPRPRPPPPQLCCNPFPFPHHCRRCPPGQRCVQSPFGIYRYCSPIFKPYPNERPGPVSVDQD